MKGEKFYRPEKYGYTGKIFEEDFVGSIKKSPDYQKALFELKEKTKKGDYVGYNDALELAKKFQPWDPANPNKNFARDLRIEIIDQLGLEREEDMDRVKFYTSVGSPLDVFHGIDAFLEYTDKEGKTHRVTFDLSMNPAKEEYKADLIVKELADPEHESEKYLEEIKETAKNAASLLPKEKK